MGRIVNISSLTVLGITDRTAGRQIRSRQLSRSWALELAKTRITVNSVAPGPTETELFRANSTPGSAGEQRYLAIVPMGGGKPDEVAVAIAFLLSVDAAFITLGPPEIPSRLHSVWTIKSVQRLRIAHRSQ